MPRRTPERTKVSIVERAKAKLAVKAAIREEMHARGLFPADLAAQIGVSEQEMTRKLSPTDDRHVTGADLTLMDPELVESVLLRLRPEFVIVRVPPVDHAPTVAEHHAASSGCVQALLDAVGDRRITRDEGVRLEAAALRAASAALAVVALAQRAKEEGVVDAPAERGH